MRVADAELRLFQLKDNLFVTGTTSYPDRYGSKPRLVQFDPETLSKISEEVITCNEIYRPEEYMFVGLVQAGESLKYVQIKPGIMHNLPVIFSLTDGACLEHTNLSIYDDWDLRVLKLKNKFSFHGSTFYDIALNKVWTIPSGDLKERVTKSCASAFTDVRLFTQERIITVTCLNYVEGDYELDRVFGFKIPADLDPPDKPWGNLTDKLKSIFK